MQIPGVTEEERAGYRRMGQRLFISLEPQSATEDFLFSILLIDEEAHAET
jgi:hypothetical protein